MAVALSQRVNGDKDEERRFQLELHGIQPAAPGFVPSPGLPDRFEESPEEASPAWRRALELSARHRRN